MAVGVLLGTAPACPVMFVSLFHYLALTDDEVAAFGASWQALEGDPCPN